MQERRTAVLLPLLRVLCETLQIVVYNHDERRHTTLSKFELSFYKNLGIKVHRAESNANARVGVGWRGFQECTP
jgi:hypothetical protein